MIVPPTFTPGPDGIVQDHKLRVALVVNVDHLRLPGALSAGGGDHYVGIIATKQNLEFKSINI